MFNVTGGELFMVLVVALLVLGPERLPTAARKVGEVLGQLRDLSEGFKREVSQALDDPGEPIVKPMSRPQLTALDGGGSDASEQSGEADGAQAAGEPEATETHVSDSGEATGQRAGGLNQPLGPGKASTGGLNTEPQGPSANGLSSEVPTPSTNGLNREPLATAPGGLKKGPPSSAGRGENKTRPAAAPSGLNHEPPVVPGGAEPPAVVALPDPLSPDAEAPRPSEPQRPSEPTTDR
jgi:sec-independent protein translocase protein TatB